MVRVHWSADPEKTYQWALKEYGKFSDDAFWLQELEIQYDAREGQRVYPEFDASIHVVPAEFIRGRKLTRYMSIDPHPRTPHAMLWVGIDAMSDWWVYRELWPSVVSGIPKVLKDSDEENSFTIRDYCETIAVLEGNQLEWRRPETDDEYAIYRQTGGEKIVYRFMDQAGKAFRASGEGQEIETYAKRYDRFGIQCQDPIKSHTAGEDAIRALLKVRKHDIYGRWPRLHISADCPELILELQKYKYPSLKRQNLEKELPQQGVEARSHMIDNLRYLATGAGVTWIPSLAS